MINQGLAKRELDLQIKTRFHNTESRVCIHEKIVIISSNLIVCAASLHRFCLVYVCSMTIIWLFYFSFRAKEVGTALNLVLGLLIIISLLTIWITFSKHYKPHMTTISLVGLLILHILLSIFMKSLIFSTSGLCFVFYSIVPQLGLLRRISTEYFRKLLNFDHLHSVHLHYYSP